MAQNERKEQQKTEAQAGQTPGKVKANPYITGADGKIYHLAVQAENKIPSVYPAIDNDLAVENITNDFDMTQADAQDLK